MGYESNWANTSDVVRQHYNEREVDEKFGGQVTTSGKTKEVSWRFTYDDLPSAAEGKMEYTIPAGAYIKNAYAKVITAFVGGTSYDIGLQEADGTPIDNDGLWDALTTAQLAAGLWNNSEDHAGTNSGALLRSALSEDGQLVASASGTYTAGEVEIVVEYID